MSGKQIKLFLVDGTPGGLTTAEITNWTGHLLSGRRSDLANLLKRDEAQRTGVYLAGSVVVASWHGVGKADSTQKAYASYRAQHEQLVSDGSIVVENGRGHLAPTLCSRRPRQREPSRSGGPATAVVSGSLAARRSATGRAVVSSEPASPVVHARKGN